MAVIVLVTPGPAVTIATPGIPDKRDTASAAKTVVHSLRTSITRIPRCFKVTIYFTNCLQKMNFNYILLENVDTVENLASDNKS